MLKKCAAFLLIAFCLNVIDIPPTFFAGLSNPKTCCGRIICECTHAKGAFCSIRHQKKIKFSKAVDQPKSAEPMAMGKHCHLKEGLKNAPKVKTALMVPKQPVRHGPMSFFKKAPCHSEKTSAAGTSVIKDFLNQATCQKFGNFNPNVWYPLLFDHNEISFVSTIERPPQVLLFRF